MGPVNALLFHISPSGLLPVARGALPGQEEPGSLLPAGVHTILAGHAGNRRHLFRPW